MPKRSAYSPRAETRRIATASHPAGAGGKISGGSAVRRSSIACRDSFSAARRVCQSPSETVSAQNARVATVISGPGRNCQRTVTADRRLASAGPLG